MSDEADAALLALLRLLEGRGYGFVTPTPETHARVLARPSRKVARDLADVLGWSLPAPPGVIDADVEALLREAGMAKVTPQGLASLVRVSRLRGRLYLHSAYPAEADDAVFFGPDSYRFADLIVAELAGWAHGAQPRVVDIGTGAGVGAVVAAEALSEAQVTATDVNRRALRFARINAQAAGVEIETVETGDVPAGAGPIDLALANPPYILDEDGPTYRDGGSMHGGEVSLKMAQMAAQRLAPGGRLILYTGSAIVRGADPLQAALEPALQSLGCKLRYRELDPDVFGEELEKPRYADVDRIALVAAIVDRPG